MNKRIKKNLKRPVCLFVKHDWHIAMHGPGGSSFSCGRCPATIGSWDDQGMIDQGYAAMLKDPENPKKVQSWRYKLPKFWQDRL